MNQSPPFLPQVKELLLLYYVKLHQIFIYSSGSFTASWSHHRTIRIVIVIRSASVQSSYMGQQVTCSDMVDCRLLIYFPMGRIPVDYISSTTGGYSRSPPDPCLSVSPVICRVAWWWNPSRTLSISPATSQLSLPYNITDYATAFFISPWDRTVAPIFSWTISTIPHLLVYIRRFWYTANQFLLL